MKNSARPRSGRLNRIGRSSLPVLSASLSPRAWHTLSTRLAGTAVAASGVLLIALAWNHRSPLWHGAFLGLLGLTQVTWAIAWTMRPSFAAAWTGVGLSVYLIPIWALAASLRLPIETTATVPGLGLAATLFSIAAALSLSSVLAMSPPVMGTVKFIAWAAIPAAALGGATFGLGLLVDLLTREAIRH